MSAEAPLFGTHTMTTYLPLDWKYRKGNNIIISPHLQKAKRDGTHFFLPIILDIIRTNPFFGFVPVLVLLLLITGLLAECDRLVLLPVVVARLDDDGGVLMLLGDVVSVYARRTCCCPATLGLLKCDAPLLPAGTTDVTASVVAT
jgi:hypothetical protein